MPDDRSSSLHAHFGRTAELLQAIDLGQLQRIEELLATARAERRRVFTFGNGGSAALAMHFATDLSLIPPVGGAQFDVVCISANLPLVSALANDIGFEAVFARQLAAQARAGDLVMGISASGNSPNCVAALRQAREIGVVTASMLAFDGGEMRSLSDACLHVPIDDYRLAESVHLVACHALSSALAA